MANDQRDHRYNCLFPWLKKKMPDRDYMYSILATTRYEQLKKMTNNSQKRKGQHTLVMNLYILRRTSELK